MHVVIGFLCEEGYKAAEIHRRMSNVYDSTFVSDNKMRQLCRNFEAGRIDVHDVGGQGRKRVLTDESSTIHITHSSSNFGCMAHLRITKSNYSTHFTFDERLLF